MTDLFEQFGEALAEFKMRNIDAAGLHEIIGEFAPLIGVATDMSSLLALSPKTSANSPPDKKSVIKESGDKPNVEKLNFRLCARNGFPKKSDTDRMSVGSTTFDTEIISVSDTALDLSMKRKSKETDLHGSKSKSEFDSKVPMTKTCIIQNNPSVFNKSRHSLESHISGNIPAINPNAFTCESVNVSEPESIVTTTMDNAKELNDLKIKLKHKLENSNAEELQQMYEVKSLSDLKYYQCKLCPRVYDTKYHLNRHLITHGGNRPHHCGQCGKAFSQKCDLNRHMNVHDNLRKHTCFVCGKSFKRADYLSKHERQYCGVLKPHKCSKCFKGFEDVEQLNEHNCAPRREGSMFTCENCIEKFASVDELVVHRKVHSIKEADYQCTKCFDKFTGFTAYVEHFKKHSGERPYTCDLCGKVFTRNHNLMTHMWVHNQEKQHTCPICAKTFTYYSNLQVHLRVHRNERPYKCDECDKGFLTSSDLRRHKRTHSGEKPYHCEKCPAEYARKERLISHMVIHMEDGDNGRDITAENLLSLNGEVSKDSPLPDEDLSMDGIIATEAEDKESKDSSQINY